VAEAEHSAGWRNGRKGAFGKPKGNGGARRLRSAKPMRGNRAVQGLPAPRKGLACGGKPRSSEKGQGGRRPGRVGAAGQGKPLKGANLTGGTGRFTRVMCQRTRHTGQNREGLRKVRVVRGTGNGKTPLCRGAIPQRGEEPYEGNWPGRISEMTRGGQSAGIRSDSEEGLKRRRGSRRAERRHDTCGEGQTARRRETAGRERLSRDGRRSPWFTPSSAG
jgi:hypothetical protein